MEESFENAKVKVLIVISIMALLFSICLIKYSDIFKQDNHLDVDTFFELKGGKDYFSQNLQKLIPYRETNNPKYLTAYQNKNTTAININNAIFLSMARNYIAHKDDFTSTELIGIINQFYGNDIFIYNDTFSIDNEETCTYSYEKYHCEKTAKSGIMYAAVRNITNLRMVNNLFYLEEENIFFSINDLNYKIYSDGTYQNVVAEFTSQDIIDSNLDATDYIIKTYNQYKVKYESTFTKNGDGYLWKETKVN